MSFPATDIVPMLSQPRLTIVFFPVCVILAIWGKNRFFNAFYLSLTLTLLVLNIVMFIGNIWVA